MSFVDRTYPDVVRDILTTLTGGVAAEAHPADYDDGGALPDVHLQRRPVARVSQVSGLVAGDAGADPVPVVFGLDDYEVLPGEDADDGSVLRFLGTGRMPAPGTDIVVNYYPRTADPTPIRDVAVGSVARTLVEAVAREIATSYAQLNAAYEAAYLESATGSSLDRVVALLGFQRFRAGRPVGTVRFTRRPGAGGEVTIPAGTPVADAADTMRYETAETRTMLAGESTAEVAVRGATAATPVAEAGALTSVQRAIAGIDRVTNERPTTTAGADETDVELRARVRVALVSAAKGTLPALVNGLLALPSVRAVNIVERPDDVPGELAVAVSLQTPAAQIPAEVTDRIEELRPAGIRVRVEQAADLALAARVGLVFVGGSLPGAERERLRAAARDTLVALVGRAQVGQRLRTGALQAALVDGERIVDAQVHLTLLDPSAPDPAGDVQPAPGQAVRLAAQDITFDVDVFDAPATATTAALPVEVHAQVRPGGPDTDPQTLTSGVTARLTAYVAALTPGTTVTAQALLAALRNDAAYALDPLGLIVTFRAGDTFVQVAEGGETFTAAAGQTFTVTGVDVI
ncbi:baseplate J/gp47 family protein [Actinomadura sp. HBU206391]|uniref:baseplate J/gp47 family protein n=1 Tax=Actinomadura sp. HBU206391 TaxID=2731692 RepID=UPI0016506B92|nr:baseplate J/gp47 family protein [Actinomadura sp. HBU206391]MBC6459916.1 hypothetical protein [Actinomadura sp. HBU206391]